ncbi:alpha/beta fold hydrolase [Rudaea sp.]|uniref:alpha/beta hydrolase family protein n=1 Tax=Rudaea sp. TaxID=2136325 RepID=UPI0032205C57
MSDIETTPASPVTLTAKDGYQLSALRYAATGEAKAHLIVAGATAVPQGFYRRFAEHAASRGLTTLTLDYRGIGLSRPPTLKGFGGSYLDWSQQDLAAAVDAMASADVPLFMVGHSFGGHAFGLLPNHARVARFYGFGTGAGWYGWMPRPERWRVWLFWNVFAPPLVWWNGYLPATRVGIGEDLPPVVYRQWRRWCKFPRYYFGDPSMAGIAEHYARVRTPMVVANALDDSWALPRSRDAFVDAYCSAPMRRRDIDPRDGLGAIGHMGYFRQHARPLWDEVIDWFFDLDPAGGVRA